MARPRSLLLLGIALLCLGAVGIVGAADDPATSGATVDVQPDAHEAGGTFELRRYEDRTYKVYLPSSHSPGDDTPVMVMLHGCTQDADQFAIQTEMNQVAEQEGFAVVYPEQSRQSNSIRCFNWFDDDHTTRGNGDARIIAGVTKQAIDDDGLDASRVYVAGFSAGGAMANDVAVSYPDLFAGVGVHSGLQYDAAENSTFSGTALKGNGPSPVRKGQQAYQDMGDRAHAIPTFVIHGDDDSDVNVANANQTAVQAHVTNRLVEGASLANIDVQPADADERSSSAFDYTVSTWTDSSGDAHVKRYVVHDMGHAWAGGNPNDRYSAPDAPSASQEMWDFLSQFQNPDPSFEGHPQRFTPEPTDTPEPTATATGTGSPAGDGDGDGSDGGDGPGFGIVAALAAVAAMLVLARRRA